MILSFGRLPSRAWSSDSNLTPFEQSYNSGRQTGINLNRLRFAQPTIFAAAVIRLPVTRPLGKRAAWILAIVSTLLCTRDIPPRQMSGYRWPNDIAIYNFSDSVFLIKRMYIFVISKKITNKYASHRRCPKQFPQHKSRDKR